MTVPASDPTHAHRRPLHRLLSFSFQTILMVGLIGAVLAGRWTVAAFTSGVMLITLAPLIMKKRFRVFIPPEFELLAITFVFASLFLGEVRAYYVRFWWWDIALHTFSGFLLGILGFLLVHLLNEKEEIEVHMKPAFVALFAFFFSLAVGALWEVFEFSMDQFFGLDMQKAMLADPSGLTDTMWDLIVDAVGAGVIAVLGYGYLKTAGNDSFLERWIGSFIESNPRFFGRG